MALIATRGKFHVALNGQGFLLQGAPDRLAYRQQQAPVYGQRFASGDRDYNDLSQWWYWNQTDWSGGLKNQRSWANDAKYFFSTNIDTWSQPGSIRLTRQQGEIGGTADEAFDESMSCGASGDLGGTQSNLIGTFDNSGDSKPKLYKAPSGVAQTWTEVAGSTFNAGQNVVSQIVFRAGFAWVMLAGTVTQTKLFTYDGTTLSDKTSQIDTLTTNDGLACRSGCVADGDFYVFTDDYLNNTYGLLHTSAEDPSASGDWTLDFEVENSDGAPVDCIYYNGSIYYLLAASGYMELWRWDIANSIRVVVQRFDGTEVGLLSGKGGKYLKILNGLLVVTVPPREVWVTNGSVLERIFNQDEFKDNWAYGATESDVNLEDGCVILDNKLWWGNLMYDGNNFYNTWKTESDSSTSYVIPLFSDSAGRIWETRDGQETTLQYISIRGSAYKQSIDENYIVFSQFDNIAGVDKLGHSVTIIFRKFDEAEKIVVKYLTDELTEAVDPTWTTLGEASYATDGNAVTFKTFKFPDGMTFKKLWLRIDLDGDGTSTPVLEDFVMEYLPMPTYKKLWTLRMNLGDEVKRLDGSVVETTGRQLRSLLEHAWWTKSALDFQDLDFASTTLSDNPLSASATTITVPAQGTEAFPEAGRIRIDDEEITYTGKTPTTFTGCVRGARGTRAAAHSTDAVISNAYKVILSNLEIDVPIALEDKQLEYTATITIRET